MTTVTKNQPTNERTAKNMEKLERFNHFKEKHPDCLLLFRYGHFYYAYKEDAAKLTESCNVSQQPLDGTDAMVASFPQQALDIYLPKMIRKGYRVAITDCEEYTTNH